MFSKLMRLGRDPELRHLPDGTPVMNLVCAYSYGKKGSDGKKPTQWIEIVSFGKQAEALHPYLHKGDLVSVSLDELHIEEYEGKNGKGHKLCGRLAGFDFVPNQHKPDAPITQTAPKPEPVKTQSFDDFKDDIPFN